MSGNVKALGALHPEPFGCPYTNGFIEGCNNTIKILKRIANVY